jgi:hypothetical protein
VVLRSGLTPTRLFGAVLIILVAAWTLMVAIDVLGIGDIRGDAMTRTVGAPLVLLWAFGEGGPIELLQWTCLGACLVLLLRVVRRPTSARGTGYRRVMILGWIGIAFMFLEDTLNTRHVFVQSVLPIIVGHVDERSALAIATELSLYWAMGGVMLAFLILGYRSFRAAPPASSYLVAGYVAYGLAAAASATRHLGGWYRRLGDGLIERIAPSAVELYQAWAPAEDIVVEVFTLGFWFMDLAVEETLELIGAAALLAAIWQLQRIETGLAPCAPAVSAAAGRSA